MLDGFIDLVRVEQQRSRTQGEKLQPSRPSVRCVYEPGTEAADLIVKGMEGALNAKTVTYDFERLMEGAKLLKCSEFGDAIIKNM